MSSASPHIEQLIGRYLAGDLPSDLADQVRQYIDIHPGRRGLMAGLQGALRGEAWGVAPNVDATWRTFTTRLELEQDMPRQPKPNASGRMPVGTHRTRENIGRQTPPTGWILRRMRGIPVVAAALGVVAIVLVGVMTSALWKTMSSRPNSSENTMTREYVTQRGQRAAILLPDGSRVQVASASRLTFSTDRTGTRYADLQGQAYFTVTHDPARPFIVRTGIVQTQVLGTSFDVRHYAADSAVRVVVVDGKVASRGRGTPVILTAGTSGTITDSTATTAVANLDAAIGWTQGRLVFTDTPVSVMLATVGRWYGYEFHLADSTLATQHVTGVVSLEHPEEAMNVIQMMLEVSMTFDGKRVTLSSRRRSGRPTAPSSRTTRKALSTSSMEIGK